MVGSTECYCRYIYELTSQPSAAPTNGDNRTQQAACKALAERQATKTTNQPSKNKVMASILILLLGIALLIGVLILCALYITPETYTDDLVNILPQPDPILPVPVT